MNNCSTYQIYRFILILTFFLYLGNNQAISQEKYSVFGKVKVENGNIDNTFITILKNAEKQESKLVDNSGKFEYSLEFGHEYIFEFSKDGFVTKRVSISTFVPTEVLNRDNQFPPFKFMVSLFPAYEGLDLSIFDQPMGMIMYDKELDDFDYDREYDSQIRDAIKRAEEEAKRRAAELEAQRLAKERAYKAAIQRGDINFKARKYDLSRAGYQEALTIKAEEEYPKSQLQKIDDLIGQEQLAAAEEARLAAEKKALDDKYNSIITLADTQFSTKEYDTAKSSYSEALALKSEEKYPKNQIQKIEDILSDLKKQEEENTKLAAEQKALDDKYAAIIALADSQFTSGDYKSSKTSYTDALDLKDEELYPKEQIQKIDDLLADQKKAADEAARLAAEKKALDDKYASIIALADSQFQSGDYQSSRNAYTDALSLKAEEAYPKEQILKIDAAIADQKQAAEDVARLAAEKKAAEAAAQLAADQKAFDDKYASIIALADSQFQSGDYQSSRNAYTDALGMKAEEAYPKEQIQKIDTALADQKKAAEDAARLAANKKALDKKYADMIDQADSQFKAGNYQISKESYGLALELKANEEYPKNQISKINDLLAAQKLQADEAARLLAEKEAFEEKYALLINQADTQFDSGDYEASKSSYAEALVLKAREKYPKKQIVKIDKLLSAQRKQADENERLAAEKKALDEKYAAIIASGDSQFDSGDYLTSKTTYSDALGLKSNETYPRNQISKIDDLLAEQKRLSEKQDREAAELKGKEEKFNAFIKLADSQFSSETYDSAKKNYNLALGVKSNEAYPKSQITKIDEILSALKAQADKEARIAAAKKLKDKEYNSFIALADKYYNGKRWSSAIKEYQKAQKLKPEESYPPNRIDEIKAILLDIEKIEAEKQTQKYQYAALIEEADKMFSREEYKSAMGKYEGALELKPKESYPKNQIKRIEVIMDQLARDVRKQRELDEKYGAELIKGEKFLKQEQFSVARHHFKAALNIKPKESYPKEKLDEIAKRVEALKRAEQEAIANNPTNFESKLSIIREREYAELIEKADKSFKANQFTVAKVRYERSLRLFNREYPKKQLKEIDKLIREGKFSILSEEYRHLIAQGDKELEKNHYSVAKFYYKKANQLNSKEKYPKNQLDKIDELLNSNKNQKLNAEYQSMIDKADKAYDKKNWSVARFYYRKAKALKPGENYPKERIDLIKTNQSKK